MSGWLSAYRVLDLTDARGLLAGQIFAKLGADVIQVEPPGGSPARALAPVDEANCSYYWSAYASGKRSITLDLHREEGREILLRLAKEADFLFESAEPGVWDALGLGFDKLIQHQPQLIHTSISSFGTRGPKSRWIASELTVWAASGAMYLRRDADERPLRISVPQSYLLASGDAASGALVAHFARLQTGRGQHVDVSALQSVMHVLQCEHLAPAIGHENYSIERIAEGGLTKANFDARGTGRRAMRTKWRAKDGLVESYISLGPAAGGKTNSLFAWMTEEGAVPERMSDWDWRTLPERIESGDISTQDIEEARGHIADFLSRWTKGELQRQAMERGLLLAPIADIGDILQSEQLAAREYLVPIGDGGEQHVLPGDFVKGGQGMFAPVRRAPTAGEHNRDVYENLLGMTAADVAGLVQRQVV